MKYLTREAARLFLNSSRDAFFLGFVSRSQLMDRLVALKKMCSHSNPAGILADRILRAEEWESNDEWQYDDHLQSDDSQSEIKPSSLHRAHEHFSNEEEDEPFLFFFAGTHTGLSNWEFHQYDDDFFPSIPHGHWNGRQQPKLDPYQGWVYHGSKQQRREPRKKIVALWNDRKFREFARLSIDYYVTHHPKYNGWRVSNPRRLPRLR